MYIFPTYFAKRNFRSHFLRKFLKPLANKICDVMWGWEISTWRTEHSNYLPKSHHGCNLRCIWLYVLLQKYPRVKGRIPAANAKSKWFWQRWMQNICRAVPLPKDENFFFARIISEKIASSETLRWGILYLFPCSGNP